MTDQRPSPDAAPIGPLLLDVPPTPPRRESFAAPSPSPLSPSISPPAPMLVTLDEQTAAKITPTNDPPSDATGDLAPSDGGATPEIALTLDAPSKWPLRLLTGGVAAAVLTAAGLNAADLLTRAFAVNQGLGWGLAAMLGGAGAGLIGILWREWRGLARLRRYEALRAQAEQAARDDFSGGGAGARAVGAVAALYQSRPELAPGLERLRLHLPDAHDDKQMLALTEREVLAPLDAAAYRLTSQAARDTALATALIPVALLDMTIVAWRNLKLVRDIAAIYGVRPGYWGSLALTRKLLGNLAVAGAGEGLTHAAVDTLGGTLAAAVSVNLGKGVVNGLLTARIGLAAMHFCRPLAFSPARRPTLGAIRGALLGLSKSAF